MGTVPSPYSPVAGDDATQARVVTWSDSCAYLLGNATSGGSKKPLCVMRQTVAQSIPSGTDAAVTFDAEDVDYDNGHSTTTNTSRYTAATAGWHDIDFYATFASNTSGVRGCYLRTNGVTQVPGTNLEFPPASGGGTYFGFSRSLYLNVGDYVELMLAQTSGAALSTVVATPAQPTMSVKWRSN